MSHHWSLLSIFVTIFLFQISYLHSTPTHFDTANHIIDENGDNQHTQYAFLYLIKNILDEPNSSEQTMLLNQLREYLNHRCITGYFGETHAHACQHIVDIVHQLNKNDDENNVALVNDNRNNEHHGLQKRFFCNGFIGCRNVNG
jgi:hypothetical protein